jgi:hypothetical protein
LGEIFRDVRRLHEPPNVGSETRKVIAKQFVKGLLVARGEARRECDIGCVNGGTCVSLRTGVVAGETEIRTATVIAAITIQSLKEERQLGEAHSSSVPRTGHRHA